MKMRYSEEKADKLVDVYSDTLVNKEIDPYGNKKIMYAISKLRKFNSFRLDKLPKDNGLHWRVLVTAKHVGEKDIEKDLEEVLTYFKIKHDINSIRL